MSMYSTRVNFLHGKRALALLEQLQDRQHDVVHVAESRGFRLLRVVQTARPVDYDVGEALVQAARAADRSRAVGADVIEEAVEHWTVLAHVD